MWIICGINSPSLSYHRIEQTNSYNVIKSNEIGSSAVNVNVLCHCDLVCNLGQNYSALQDSAR